MRASEDGTAKEDLLEKLRGASKKISHKVAIAKSNWSRKRAEIIHQMCTTPGYTWKATKELIAGDSCHHNKPVTTKMKMENGELATSDKENMEVFGLYFEKVYNSKRERFADAAKII